VARADDALKARTRAVAVVPAPVFIAQDKGYFRAKQGSISN
jgi:hypothetical protein